MFARSRLARSLAIAFGSAILAAPALRAQDIAVAPAPVAAPTTATVTSATPPAGPTLDAASVGVRHAATATTAAAPRRGNYGQPIALMVVGGAAVLVGLIIGGGAGAAIAVAGAVAGLVGLYQYLQ